MDIGERDLSTDAAKKSFSFHKLLPRNFYPTISHLLFLIYIFASYTSKKSILFYQKLCAYFLLIFWKSVVLYSYHSAYHIVLLGITWLLKFHSYVLFFLTGVSLLKCRKHPSLSGDLQTPKFLPWGIISFKCFMYEDNKEIHSCIGILLQLDGSVFRFISNIHTSQMVCKMLLVLINSCKRWVDATFY